MSKISRLTSILLTSVFFLSLLVFINASNAVADVIEENECFPAVLMLRGSNETQLEEEKRTYFQKNEDNMISYIKTNGHEGERISQLIRNFTQETDPSKTVSKTRFIGVDYPALDVFPKIPSFDETTNLATKSFIISREITKHIIKYNDSYNEGARKVVELIKEDERRGCDTQYMLVGYSQGALSARLAINLLGYDNNKIVSTYMIGDPFQKADGASSERQRSIANTSSHTDGTFRSSLDSLIKISESNPDFSVESILYREFYNSFTNADNLIYKDEGEYNFVSRSLCHLNDLVCGFNLENYSIEEHTNYFTRPENDGSLINFPGDIDLRYEIKEFDKQVQSLANSSAADPRERTLTKTSAIKGGSVILNVTNTQADDKCSWDFNNDKIFEIENSNCAPVSIIQKDDTSAIKVIVEDSFGIKHTLSSEIEALDPDFIESSIDLSSNNWYQFKEYKEPLSEKDKNNGWYYDPNGNWIYDDDWSYPDNSERCINFNQYPQEKINQYYYSNLDLSYCSEASDKKASSGLQAFKTVSYLTSSGKKNRIISGYDDDYSLTKDDSYSNSEEDLITLKLTSSSNLQDFEARISDVIDNKIFYKIISSGKCLTSIDEFYFNDQEYLALKDCEINNTNQLFEAFKISGDFGSLSVEKDITPPTPVDNIYIEVEDDLVSLKWDESEDIGRDQPTENYKIFKKGNSGEFTLIDIVYMTDTFNLDDLKQNELNYYRIIAQDSAGNESEPRDISFITPPKVKKPLKIEVIETSPKGDIVKIKIAEYDRSKIEGIKLFRSPNESVGFYEGTVITLNLGEIHNQDYSYRYKISENIMSVESDIVQINNYCSPNCELDNIIIN